MKYTKDFILGNIKPNFDGHFYPQEILEEFEIFDCINYDAKKGRLKKTMFYSWICTDTEVGIAVYYLDDLPVCVSFQPYRKSKEVFYWLGKEEVKNTEQYLRSLVKPIDEVSINLFTEDIDFKEITDKINYKKFEKHNY